MSNSSDPYTSGATLGPSELGWDILQLLQLPEAQVPKAAPKLQQQELLEGLEASSSHGVGFRV